MTIDTMLDGLEIPKEYFSFKEKCGVQPPFLLWYFPNSRNFSADGKVYVRRGPLNIELYTDRKDFELEEKLEAILEENGFFWEKTEAYIESEELYEVLYEMEVLINEQQNEQQN